MEGGGNQGSVVRMTSLANKNTIVCSFCGKSEEEVCFSNRQRNKAIMNEGGARCVSCIEAADANANAASKVNENTTIQAPVPRKKRRIEDEEEQQDGFSGEDELPTSDNDNETGNKNGENQHDVSINDIKKEVLGREWEVETTPENEQDRDIAQIRHLMETTAAGRKNNVANQLQQDVQCAICQDLFYPPVSLLCGHSFCQDCLDWWWKSSSAMTCPSCRESAPYGMSSAALNVNVALKRCMMLLYPHQVARKLETLKKMTAGEDSGTHDRGYEVLSPLDDEFWRSVMTTTTTTTTTTRMTTDESTNQNNTKMVGVRRNIVLDANDQRMQLALALYDHPIRRPNGLDVSLCLLSMEEDEASDCGFPMVVTTNVEDEHLICTNEDRHRLSPIQIEMTKEDGSIAPVARIHPRLMPPGIFEVPFDATTCSFHHEAMMLRLCHESTMTVVELDLASLKMGASGGSFTSMAQRGQIRQEPSRRRQQQSMVMDELDRHGGDDDDDNTDEYEDLDEFEDDGFLVNENEQSDVEGNFSGEEEEDACCICKDGGELMVCDGGREMDGCGRNFHLECVSRSTLPEGDWVCSECAKSGGIHVEGKKGHEFVKRSLFGDHGAHDDSTEQAAGHGGRIVDDSSDEEENIARSEPNNGFKTDPSPINQPNGTENKKRRTIALDDSDDDD